MNKTILILCLLLGACVSAGKRGGDSPMAIHDFGGPAARLAGSESAVPMTVDVHAPFWIDSLGIEYRLAYAEPNRLRDYSQARWAGPPASLIQQRLMQRLGLLPFGQAGARCLLRVDVDEFSQVFDTAQTSRGLLKARVTVFDGQRNKVLEREMRIEKPAMSGDSRGGVAALTMAVEQLAVDLQALQAEGTRSGALAACRK